MKDEKKSIVKEALTDYKEILEAADANAKKKLAEEFPEKFNNLLKEELQNKKNKSAKESYKKLDEAELKNECDMKKEVKETVAVKSEPFDEKPKGVQKVAEDVKVTDTVGKGDPFKEKAKGKAKDTIDEEREKDFMADVEAKTPNQGKGEAEKGKIFNEKLKGPSSGKPIANMTEELNLTGAPMDSVGTALEGAGELDEILTLDEIESEIAAMEGLGEELPEEQPQSSNPYQELVEMRDKIDGMLKGMEEQKNNGGLGANKVNAGGPTQPMIDEIGMEEQKNNGGQGANRVNAGGPTQPMIDEKEEEITPEMINQVLGKEEQPVEETIAMPHPNKRVTTATLPGKEYQSPGNVERMRDAVQETQKKISSLIEVNKKLTKKLNEAKKYKESVTGLVENYKSALDKYRSQLKEMAVFNTNLAHVNNLLVNEELALTQEDKIKIINEFKKVDSIASSQTVYKNFLNEMKGGKKTLTESIETKVSASIQPSSKQKLDEVVEKTAYADDKHLQRMRKLIETIEHRGKK